MSDPHGPSRCGHCGPLADTFLARWPAGTVVFWWLDESTLPAVLASAPTAVRVTLEAAFSAWERVCGAIIEPVSDRTIARVIVRFAPIDGPWNVLALTELPMGDPSAVLSMTLDSAEAWTLDLLQHVGTHEFGHALGIGHADPATLAVMDPTYQPGLDLQPWDVAQAVARYGLPSDLAFALNFPAAGAYRITVGPADDDPANPPAELTIHVPSAGDYRLGLERWS